MTLDAAIEVPAVAQLLRKVAIGAARWGEKTRQDVVKARVQVGDDGNVFVLRLSSTGAHQPLFRSIIVSTFVNAQRFVRSNPDAPAALAALARWAVTWTAKGAIRFETRWSPSSEGFLASSAIADVARSA